MVRGDWIKPGATVIDVGINRVPGDDRQVEAGRRRGLRRSAAGRGRDHAGAGRRRPDDHRLPDGQHRARGLRDRRIAAAGGLNLRGAARAYPSPYGEGGRERSERPGGVELCCSESPPGLARLSPRRLPSPKPGRDAVALPARTTKTRQRPGHPQLEFEFSYSRRRRPYRGSFRRTAPRSGRPPCRRAPCRTPPPDRCPTAPRPRGFSVRSGRGRGAPR